MLQAVLGLFVVCLGMLVLASGLVLFWWFQGWGPTRFRTPAYSRCSLPTYGFSQGVLFARVDKQALRIPGTHGASWHHHESYLGPYTAVELLFSHLADMRARTFAKQQVRFSHSFFYDP